MNYLNKMYGRNKPQQSQSSDKNPNRVAGGLRAQGADHFTMLGEDGMEQQIPTQRYVQSLEDQLKKQRVAVDILERKISKQRTSIDAIENYIRNNRND
jgi:hypothetical protein